MTVEVKICGLNDADALEAAIGAGTDLVGFVFYPPSPRHLDLASAGELAERARGRAGIVALMVDPDDAGVVDVAEAVRPDYIQLHGSEGVTRVGEIARLTGIDIIKAVKVASARDVAAGESYRTVAARLLYDAKTRDDAPGRLPGGNGIAFDWRLLAGVDRTTGYLLSGGLDPTNVAAALALTGAPAIDVSSGVESAPGRKDTRLIREFLEAAKRAPARDNIEACNHV